jgi:hypothetical protein
VKPSHRAFLAGQIQGRLGRTPVRPSSSCGTPIAGGPSAGVALCAPIRPVSTASRRFSVGLAARRLGRFERGAGRAAGQPKSADVISATAMISDRPSTTGWPSVGIVDARSGPAAPAGRPGGRGSEAGGRRRLDADALPVDGACRCTGSTVGNITPRPHRLRAAEGRRPATPASCGEHGWRRVRTRRQAPGRTCR